MRLLLSDTLLKPVSTVGCLPVGRTVLLSRLLYWLDLNKMVAVRQSTALDGYLRANTSREGHGWPCSHEECVMGFIYIP